MQKSNSNPAAYAVLIRGCPPTSDVQLPLPTASKPGNWFTKPAELDITDQPAGLWTQGAKVFLVEVDSSDDSRMRLTRSLNNKQLVELSIFQDGFHVVSSGVCAVSGKARLEAGGDVIVYASGDSFTTARGKARIVASGHAKGRCYGEVSLLAAGQSNFTLYETATAQAQGHSHVTGYGYAKVDASEDAHVDLYDLCQGNAEGRALVRGYGRSRIWASDQTRVKTFAEAKAFLRDEADATADGRSQVFAAPGVSVRSRMFAGVTPLQHWPELSRLTS